MGRKTIGEMQDIVLHGMEKATRKGVGSERTIKIKTLAEQLKEAEQWKKLSVHEQLKATPWHDWIRDLEDEIVNKRSGTVTAGCFTWLHFKHKAKLEQFHANGTSFSDIASWARDMEMDYMNR